MRTEGGKTGTSWELFAAAAAAAAAAASPFSRLYKFVKLGKEGQDDEDEDDALEELLVQLCDCCCNGDEEGGSMRPVFLFPALIIREGA